MILADCGSSYFRSTVKSVASAALFLCAAAGCGQSSKAAQPEQVEFTGAMMGTTYHIKVVGSMTDPESTATAEAIEDALKNVDTKMSTYKSDSEVSQVNAASAGVPVSLSEDTFHVFTLARQVNEESDGAFDITVGPLVNAWGFGPAGPGKTPDDAELSELLKLVGPDKFVLDPVANTLTKTDGSVYCDPASVSEGYAVDEVAEVLLARGYKDFMVEVGGEVRCAGQNAGGGPWKIAIEKPVDGDRVIQEVVGLQDTSLSTSGNYRKFYMVDGKRISHTIDPKTGRPVAHQLASASVLHPICALADAYSTAIMVLGPEKGLAFAEKMGLPTLLIIHGEDGQLITRETGSFAQYVLPK